MKKPKLTKKDEELFKDCRGHCKVCFDEGGCSLEKKLKKMDFQYGKTIYPDVFQ